MFITAGIIDHREGKALRFCKCKTITNLGHKMRWSDQIDVIGTFILERQINISQMLYSYRLSCFADSNVMILAKNAFQITSAEKNSA